VDLTQIAGRQTVTVTVIATAEYHLRRLHFSSTPAQFRTYELVAADLTVAVSNLRRSACNFGR
jgi:hypothetical protein